MRSGRLSSDALQDKRYSMKKIFCILIIMALSVCLSSCKNEPAPHIPLEQLQKPDGSYCWGELAWGMDIDEVESTLGYSLSEKANEGLSIEDDTDYRKDPYTNTAVFMEKEPSELFGATGTVGYTFLAGSFKDVFLTFYAEENTEEQLKEVHEQLQKALAAKYGEPHEARTSELAGVFSTNRHWIGSKVNGKKTGLNCSILYADAEHSDIHSVTLATGTYGEADDSK